MILCVFSEIFLWALGLDGFNNILRNRTLLKDNDQMNEIRVNIE